MRIESMPFLKKLCATATLVVMVCASLKINGQSITPNWLNQTDIANNDIAHCIATDTLNDWIYIGGSARSLSASGLSSLGATTGGTAQNLTSYGDLDAFLIKTDLLGNILWAMTMGGAKDDEILDVCVGGDGNVYVVGYYQEHFVVKNLNGTNPTTLTDIGGGGETDCFIASFTPTGVKRWAKKEGGTSNDKNYGITSTIDGIVTIGTFTEDNESLQGINVASTHDDADVFIAKYGFNGSNTWVMAGGSEESDIDDTASPEELHYSISSYQDTLYFMSCFNGTNFNFEYSTNFNSANSSMSVFGLVPDKDYILGSITNDGKINWLRRQLCGGSQSGGMAITADCNGVFATATAEGSLIWEGPSPGFKAVTGGSDLFVARYNRLTGTPQWYKLLSNISANTDLASSIITDRVGNIYIGGMNTSDVSSGGIVLPGETNGMAFVLELNSDGIFQTQYSINTTNKVDLITDLAFTSDTDLLICGESNGNLDANQTGGNSTYDAFWGLLNNSPIFGNCCGAPIAGTLSSPQSGVCTTGNVTMTLSGSIGTISWQWSEDGITWNTDLSASGNTYSHTIDANHWFRACVSSGLCNLVYSNVIQVNFYTPLNLTCTGAITANVNTTSCTQTIAFAPIISAGCGTITLVNDYTNNANTSATFSAGNYVVKWTGTDMMGNTDTCSQFISVIDNIAPIINCPGNITTPVTTGICSKTMTGTNPTFSDNCAVTTLVWTMTGATIGNSPISGINYIGIQTFNLGITTITYLVKDGAGNNANCVQTITITDSSTPTLSLPANIFQNLTAGNCTKSITTSNATFSDNCSIVSLTWTMTGATTASSSLTGINYVGTFDFNKGVTTITYIVTDAAGNSANSTFTVTLFDTISPSILCPADVTLNVNAGSCTATAVPAMIGSPVVSDNCSLVTITNDHPSNNYSIGVNNITWNVTDESGNSASCVQTVTVVDNINPTIACTSNYTLITGSSNCTASVTIANPIIGDNCAVTKLLWTMSGATISSSPLTGINYVLNYTFALGTTTITYTAYDAAGNSASCSLNVTVSDTYNPTITCPATQTLTLNSSCGGVLGDYRSLATIADNCTATGLLVVTQLPAVGSAVSGVGTTVVTLTVTDASGNPASCAFNVNRVDTTQPTVTCPASINTALASGCSKSVITPNPTYGDNCGVTKLTWATSGATTLNSSSSGINFVGTKTFNVGATTVTYTATDAANNAMTCSFMVTVTDAILPTITCSSAITGNVSSGVCTKSINPPNPSTADNCSVTTLTWTMTGSTVASSPLTGINNIGSYLFNAGVTTVTYTAKDAAGNSSLPCSFTVTISDNIFPTISCPVVVNTTVDPGTCSKNLTISNPGFADNCTVTKLTWTMSGATVATSAITGINLIGNYTFNTGATVITYTAADAAGNSINCSHTINVADNIVPIIICPANINSATNSGCTAVITTPNPTITENCSVSKITWVMSGATVATSSVIGINYVGTNIFNPGLTNITYTVTDAAGLIASCAFQVTIVDTTLPTITCPSNIIVNTDANSCTATILQTSLGAPIANDNCTPFSVTNNHPSNTYNVGSNTVIWTVTDANGNSNTCTQTVTVNQPVVSIVCQPTINVTADYWTCAAEVNFAPLSTSGCLSSLLNNYTNSSSSSSFFPVGTTIVTWTATDIWGNITSCNTTINVTTGAPYTEPLTSSTSCGNGGSQSFPAGTWIIGMDNVTQRGTYVYPATPPGYTDQGSGTNSTLSAFNMKAYGLANELLQNEIPLYWAIADAKAKDGIDISVNATRIFPSNTAATNYDFKSGPFVIHPSDTAAARPIIQSFGNGVKVYKTNAAVNIQYEHKLTFKPKIIVLSNGARQDLHYDVLTLISGISASNITVTNAGSINLSANSCYTFCSEPHWKIGDAGASANDPSETSRVKQFLQGGGNGLIQCSGIEIYENNEFFQTTSGIVPDGSSYYTNAQKAAAHVENGPFDFPYYQINGALHNDPTGTFVGIHIMGPSAYQAALNKMVEKSGTYAGDQVTGYIDLNGATPGGNLFYLGGHDWRKNSSGQAPYDITSVNGLRLYMNAVFTPPNKPLCSDITFCDPCDASFHYPICSVCQGPNLTPVIIGNSGGVFSAPAGVIINASTGIINSASSTAGGPYLITYTSPFGCSESVFVTILSSGPLTISCPANIINNVSPGLCSTTIASLGTATASGGCGVYAVTNNNPSTTYPIGVTSVIWTATDGTTTTTCTQTVTVLDNIIPSITCPANIIQTATSGVCYRSINTPNPTNSDNCSVVTRIWTMTGATTLSSALTGLNNVGTKTFNVGITTVTYTVFDAVGNFGTCSFNVTVTDTQAPNLTCASAQTLILDAACAATLPNYIPLALISDNCAIASTTQTPAAGTAVSGAGQMNVTISTIDVNGNTTSCTFVVTKTESTAPAIICPADITSDNSAAICGALVTYNLNYSDNCTYGACAPISIPGYTKIGTLNGHTYFRSNSSLAPAAAEAAALALGGHLATITTAAENAYLNGIGIHYIGFNDATTEGIFVWQNGEPVTYTNWNGGEPNDQGGAEDWAVINWAGGTAWNDFTGNRPFIVEFDCTYNLVAGQETNTIFPIGTTAVTYTVTDGSGNTSPSCSFNVNVNDNTAPVMTCPATINATTDVGNSACSVAVNYPTPISYDNCGNCTTAPTITGFTSLGLNSGRAYYISTASLSYADAVTACANAGGYLVSIESAAENSFIRTAATTNGIGNYMIGFTDQVVEGTFIWGNGQPVTYTNWNVGEPNNNGGNEVLTRVVVSGSWHDFNGNAVFVMELPCLPVTLQSGPASGSTFPVGTTAITYNSADASGNISTCSFNVVVTDNTVPTIICPAAQTLSLGAGCSALLPNYTSLATVSDNCTAAYSITVTQSPMAGTSVNGIGTTVITLTATDGSGNSATCTFNVNRVDITAPTITCPAPQPLTLNSSCAGVLGDYSALAIIGDNCTATGSLVVSQSPAAGTAVSGVGTTVVTLTVTDASNNPASCSFNVTTSDDVAPVISSCPANISVGTNAASCNATVLAAALGVPIATDNCSVPTFINNHPSTTYPTGVTTVIWTATDAAGNFSTCSQTVTVSDDDVPVIVSCPTDISVGTNAASCDATVLAAALGLPVATDDCSVPTFTNNHPSTTYPTGVTTVIWTATDASGNSSTCSQNVTVSDDDAPVITTCPSNISVGTNAASCNATILAAALGVPIATDNCSVPTFTNNHPSATYPTGVTTVIWTATDEAGNNNTCEQIITVVDDTPPYFTSCPENINVLLNNGCQAWLDIPTPIVFDNCSQFSITHNCPFSQNNQDASAFYPTGTTIVIWTATDVAGNTNTCTQIIQVVDVGLPTIICPPDTSVITTMNECNAQVILPIPDVDDNCGLASISNSINGTYNASDIYDLGTTTVTWNIVDFSGNTATCSHLVHVIDSIPPSILCSSDIQIYNTVFSCDAELLDSEIVAPTGSDNCSSIIITNDHPSSTYEYGDNTIQWQATDASGNIAVCEQHITVLDTISPMIVCPLSLEVLVLTGTIESFISPPAPLVADNCSLNSIMNDYTMQEDASAMYPVGNTTITWTATDLSGNESTCTSEVSVLAEIGTYLSCEDTVMAYSLPELCGNQVTIPIPLTNLSNFSNDNNGSNDASGFYAVGEHLIVWNASDALGNYLTCETHVIVLDTISPIIYCENEITIQTDPGETFAITTLTIPDADDNCGNYTIQNNITGLSNLPIQLNIGDHIVFWTATDASGNNSSCSSTIHVIDNEAPIIICDDTIQVNVNFDLCYTSLLLNIPQIVDPEINSTLTNDFSPDNTELVEMQTGTNVVVWTITDVNGNENSCSSTYIILDQFAPVVNCIDTIEVYSTLNSCLTWVEIAQPEATDNCSVSSVTNSYNNGYYASDFYPIGQTQVYWSVSDISGNLGTCQSIVNVIDTIPPTIICPGDTTIWLYENQSFSTPDYTDLLSIEDFCSPYTNIVQSIAVGTNITSDTTITFQVIDNYENSSWCTMQINIINISAPVLLNCPDTITFFLSNNCLVEVTDHTNDLGVNNVSTEGTFTIYQYPPVGESTPFEYLQIWVVNEFGFSSDTCFVPVQFIDNIDPMFGSAIPAILYLDENCEAIIPDYSEWITFQDNCGEVLTYIQNPAQGTVYTGAQNISATYWVMDESENMSEVPYQFEIQVIDDQAPIVFAPSEFNLTLDNNCEVIIPDFSTILQIEECSAYAIEQSLQIGETISGVQSVWVSIQVTQIGSDLFTNVGFLLNTIDNTAPITDAISDMAINQDVGNCSAYFDPSTIITAEDYCDANPEIVVIGNETNQYAIGDHLIEYYALDASGNQSDTLSFILTVVDTEAPVFIYVNDTTTCDVNFQQAIYVMDCGTMIQADENNVQLTEGINTLAYSYSDGTFTSNFSYIVTLSSMPAIIWATIPTATCEGGEAFTLDVTTEADYTLSVEDIILDQNIFDPSQFEPGEYVVHLNASFLECTTELAQVITILPLPQLTLAALNTSTCNHEITVTASSSATQINWSSQGNIVITNQSPYQITATNENYGAEWIYAEATESGCSIVDSLELTYYEQPGAPDAGPDQNLYLAVETNLDGNYNGPGSTTWNVISGNGVVEDDQALQAIMTDLSLGNNDVILVAQNGICYATDTVRIVVNGLFIPDGYSPNGDGVNEAFVILGLENVKQAKLIIFNRWGQIVYSTDQYNNDWFATNSSGEPLIEDTYFYEVDLDGEKYQGFVVVKK